MKKTTSQLWVYLILLLIGFILMVQVTYHPVKIIYPLLSILFLLPCLVVPTSKTGLVTLAIISLIGYRTPDLLYFLPATLYFIFLTANIQRKMLPTVVSCICLYFTILPIAVPLKILLFSLTSLSFYLYAQAEEISELTTRFLKLKDDSWEKETLQSRKQQSLLLAQETEIELKILQERARIAHDIHDNVGHLLSSSVIQLGAVEAINTSPELVLPLQQLNETIHQGMDSIRGSIHNLHYESLSLTDSLSHLIDNFSFCSVSTEGSIFGNLNAETNKVIFFAVKEALANIMKHSQATTCWLTFTELPAFYRLRIKNNGAHFTNESLKSGIGLYSMRERVKGVNGQLHLVGEKDWFMLTIVLPKEGHYD